MKIKADKYQTFKDKFGSAIDLIPVDLNDAYVAFDTSQEAKEGSANLENSHQCNLERFGLTENGI